MDACEAYARQWEKKKYVELGTLSEWIKSIGDVLKRRTSDLNILSSPDTSPFLVNQMLSKSFPVSLITLS